MNLSRKRGEKQNAMIKIRRKKEGTRRGQLDNDLCNKKHVLSFHKIKLSIGVYPISANLALNNFKMIIFTLITSLPYASVSSLMKRNIKYQNLS